LTAILSDIQGEGRQGTEMQRVGADPEVLKSKQEAERKYIRITAGIIAAWSESGFQMRWKNLMQFKS